MTQGKRGERREKRREGKGDEEEEDRRVPHTLSRRAAVRKAVLER